MSPYLFALRGVLRILLVGAVLLILVIPLGGRHVAAAPPADPVSLLVLAPRGLLDGIKGVEVVADYGDQVLYRVPDHVLAGLAPEVQAQVKVVQSQAEAEEVLGIAPAGGEGPAPEATWPGPDGYGYSGQITTYNWIEISGSGTSVALGDDNFGGPYSLGFTFSFYGASYTELYIASNGYIAFGAGSSDLSDDCPLPNINTPDNIVALMWDDLDPGDTGDLVYYQSFSSCPIGGGRCMVVQYQNYHHYSFTPPGPVAGTFEAVLFANGDILVQFQDAGEEAGSYSTTGIEGANYSADHGLAYTCGTGTPTLADGMALRFTREPDFSISAAPALRTICTPANAVYTVTLGQLNGFNEAVTLSASGHPAGTTATFVPNPRTPPGTSMLTIGNTGAAAFGLYNITILGTAPSKSHSTGVQLQVYTGVPAAPALVSPANGATGVALKPTLTWNAAAQATGYFVQVATDAGFGNVVYSAAESTTSHNVAAQLNPTTLYYWRVRGNNLCGNGAYSGAWSFTTRAIPPILLVDDDDNAPDVRSYYTTALDAIGVGYDVWDTGNTDTNEPDAATLALYQTVIWFSGDNTGSPGPGATAETALGSWLSGGSRCFFISSEDYYYDKGLTPFMQTYLGVSSVGSDTGDYTSVTGQGAAFGGLGPYNLDYGGAGLSDWSDIVNPNATAEVAFLGNNSNNAALDKDAGAYRTTFWGYPWEALRRAQDRREAMQAVVDWCLLPDFTIAAAPAARSICAPADAVYTVTLGQYSSFNSPVALSAAGHPAGTTATFVPNPRTPPGASILTIGNTGAAAAGLYNITITGVGGGRTHNTAVQLQVAAGVPPAPTLVLPADGATGVALLPTLQWNAVAGATSYFLQVATDPAFTIIVYSTTTAGTSHTLTTPLNGNTLHYWRVRGSNACGDGPYAAAFRFTTILGDMTVSPDNLGLDIFLNCDTAGYNGAFQVQRVGAGQTYAPADEPGDYGLFISYNGCEIGPDTVGQYYDGDWDTCADGAVTGSGTTLDPWAGTARFTTGDCAGYNLTLAYTVTYVDGDDFYETAWKVCGGTPGTAFKSYFAGDLYMAGSDYGYGYYDAASHSVGTKRYVPPQTYMFFTPVNPAPANHYQEALFSTIWSVIAAGGDFNDTIDTGYKDTGAGLQWNLTFDALGCASASARTTFAENVIYVDDDYTAATPGWQVTRFDKIQDGINAAGAGYYVYVENVAAGGAEAYNESVNLNKAITVTVNGSMQLNGSLTIGQGRWESTLGTMGLTGNFARNGGAFDARTGTVRFNGGALSLYSGGPTTFYNVIVDPLTVLEINEGDPLFAVSGSIVNNGALRQTLDVPANPATTTFLNISTNKYYGVAIQPTAQTLGRTVVTVWGNQGCPYSPNGGGPTVLRCFELDPQRTNRSANVTFYYRDAEENAQTAPEVYHWNGAAWDLQTFADRDTGGVENNWVRATGIAAYSPFALWGGVTAVKLTSFAAVPAAGGVLLTWETASEHGNVGFHLYRSATAEAEGERVNENLIPSRAPGGGAGAAYEYLDAPAGPGVTYYWLEDVDVNGARTRHGPVMAGLWRAYLPVVTH